MHAWKLAAAVCVVVGVVLSPPVMADDATPEVPLGFRVLDDTIDAGEVIAGRIAEATFEFRNDTDAEVRILRAAPS